MRNSKGTLSSDIRTVCILTRERWPCVRRVARKRVAESRLFVPEAVAKQTLLRPDSTMPGTLKRSPLKRPGAALRITKDYGV